MCIRDRFVTALHQSEWTALPHPPFVMDDTVRARKNAILAIYEGLQQKRKHADNTDLMVRCV